MSRLHLCLTLALACSFASPSSAETQVVIGRSAVLTDFTFKDVPAPATNDAATSAVWSVIDGEPDPNGGSLQVLHDGRVPTHSDEPAANFFFRAGSRGGRLLLDLQQPVSIQQINSYSWHAGSRSPQVYRVYGAEGTEAQFNLKPSRKTDPATCGWKQIAAVDTRSEEAEDAEQHAVAITGSSGTVGTYRYLLFEMDVTETRDPFGNTFFSEIDVIDSQGPPATFVKTSQEDRILKKFETADGKYRFTVDATTAPDLAEWSEKTLAPVILEWYPKIAELLSDKEFTARNDVLLKFRDDMERVPASASGNVVNLNAQWFRGELNREARGAVIHELVHIVQDYPRGNHKNPDARRTPGWVVEGIADYVRWYLYEPQSKGAEIGRNNLPRAKHDASYRITANFLNWVSESDDKELVKKLNSAARSGDYQASLWKTWTGKPLEELETEWKAALEARLQPAPGPDAKGR